MIADPETAQDLAQETFVKAMMHTGTIVDLSHSKRRAWLYRTFKNLFFDRCRRAILEQAYAQNGQPECAEDPELQRLENTILLQSLSPTDRAMFQLRYFDGYTAKEIAQMLHLPPGTVRSRLSRCRTFLKHYLDKG